MLIRGRPRSTLTRHLGINYLSAALMDHRPALMGNKWEIIGYQTALRRLCASLVPRPVRRYVCIYSCFSENLLLDPFYMLACTHAYAKDTNGDSLYGTCALGQGKIKEVYRPNGCICELCRIWKLPHRWISECRIRWVEGWILPNSKKY